MTGTSTPPVSDCATSMFWRYPGGAWSQTIHSTLQAAVDAQANMVRIATAAGRRIPAIRYSEDCWKTHRARTWTPGTDGWAVSDWRSRTGRQTASG